MTSVTPLLRLQLLRHNQGAADLTISPVAVAAAVPAPSASGASLYAHAGMLTVAM
jgi:hypothetical protein